MPLELRGPVPSSLRAEEGDPFLKRESQMVCISLLSIFVFSTATSFCKETMFTSTNYFKNSLMLSEVIQIFAPKSLLSGILTNLVQKLQTTSLRPFEAEDAVIF